MSNTSQGSGWTASLVALHIQEVSKLLLCYFFPPKAPSTPLYYPLDVLIASSPKYHRPSLVPNPHFPSIAVWDEDIFFEAPQSTTTGECIDPETIGLQDCSDDTSDMVSTRRSLSEETGLDFSEGTIETGTPDSDLEIEILGDETPCPVSSKRKEKMAMESRPFKRQRLLSALGDTITLVVGESETPFVIHRDLLCESSVFFKNSFKSVWKAKDAKIVQLPEDDVDTIETMCYWMYHNEICVSAKIRDRSFRFNNKHALETTQGLFIKLYMIGEKYTIPRLQNDAVDAIITHNRTIQLVEMSTYIWENSSHEGKLCNLLVRMIGFRYTATDLEADKKYICSDLMVELALAAFKHRDKGYNKFRDQVSPREAFCKEFHVHDLGMEGKCMKIKECVFADREKNE